MHKIKITLPFQFLVLEQLNGRPCYDGYHRVTKKLLVIGQTLCKGSPKVTDPGTLNKESIVSGRMNLRMVKKQEF